jgi:hypothetical protein
MTRAGAPSDAGTFSGRQQRKVRASVSATVFARYSIRTTPLRSSNVVGDVLGERPALALEQQPDRVVLREVERDRARPPRQQPVRRLAGHVGRLAPELRRPRRALPLPAAPHHHDVAGHDVTRGRREARGGNRLVRPDRDKIDHRRRADRLLERDRVGGGSARHAVARAVHVGEAVHRPAEPGRLKHVAASVIAADPALDRPAEVILDRHRQIDDPAHGAALRAGCRLSGRPG